MRTGWIETFECDLTDEQKRLCEWIAEQAHAGVRRVYYEEAQAELGIESDKELTCMLRNMRERLDQIHEMVQSPIVNTAYPYFEIHVDADHIWDRYIEAEGSAVYSEPVSFRLPQALVRC
jgi:hypothetical protein